MSRASICPGQRASAQKPQGAFPPSHSPRPLPLPPLPDTNLPRTWRWELGHYTKLHHYLHRAHNRFTNQWRLWRASSALLPGRSLPAGGSRKVSQHPPCSLGPTAGVTAPCRSAPGPRQEPKGTSGHHSATVINAFTTCQLLEEREAIKKRCSGVELAHGQTAEQEGSLKFIQLGYS